MMELMVYCCADEFHFVKFVSLLQSAVIVRITALISGVYVLSATLTECTKEDERSLERANCVLGWVTCVVEP